ncbi:MAG: flagellar biosynthesis protein FlhF [Nitrospirae bacterium]|nr:flagellar biosynthesis protein FlhF [Nitrospirota bacterium]
MQIKKYEAVDMQEALKLVKGELGPDAVILSAKQLKKDNGVFGIFSRQVTEVVAARDYAEVQNGKAPSEDPQSAIIETDEFLKKELRSIRDDMSRTPGELRDVKSELGLLKGYIQELLRGGDQEQLKILHDNLVIFFRRLISEGMDRGIAYRLVHILHNRLSDEQKDNIEDINSYGYELIRKQVKATGPICTDSRDRKIAIFIGPTGVGKTTSIAKIAAKYTLIDKKKVSLITFDTYRVGAVEQLKIYARIIGLPVEVVLSPSDLRGVIDKKRDSDLILIDTAGRSHKDRAYISELDKLMSQRTEMDSHLVLSATSSNIVLNDIIGKFKGIRINSLLFTKLDEADNYGAIFSSMINAQKPLSYFTTGQRVPEDIELATAGRLSRLILKMDAVSSN